MSSNPLIGYHASHEQFAPGMLLDMVKLAERSGFGFVLSSDHINPWSETQDNSGFAWSWLGAAMQATQLPFSVVTVPGYRYHPAVLAQAIATLCAMFPDRFNPCLGSGEALNEHVVGTDWPRKTERNRILHESVDIMRRLWGGETVTHTGRVTVNEARLYTLPPRQPTVYGAALTKQTAGWLGGWADGLITTSDSVESVGKRVQAFRAAGDLRPRPLILKAQLSYADTDEAALDAAMNQWRFTLLPGNILGELPQTAQFESAGRLVTADTVRSKLKILSRPQDAINWLEEYARLGFDIIVLHNVGRNQEQFIRDFGKHVLPYFQS